MVYQVEETVMGKEIWMMKKEMKTKLKPFLSETRESVEVRIYFFFIDMKISDVNLCCIFHFLSFYQLNLQTNYIHTCVHTYEQITFTRACTCTYILTETRIQRRKSVSAMNNLNQSPHYIILARTHIIGNGRRANLLTPQSAKWVACDLCSRWRKIPSHVDMDVRERCY